MAEAADRNYSTSIPPPSLFGSSNRDSSRLSSVAATSSPNSPPSLSSSSHVREDEEGQNHDSDQQNQFREPEIEQQRHLTGNFRTFDDRSNVIRDDTWSCIAGVLTFLLFGSMTLILGVFGSLTLRFGPSSSILITPSRIFVQSIKVEELGETKPGLILYGFYRSPPLDVVSTWSETINASVPPDSHEELIYFLNEGSQINISYCVKSDNSSIYLAIAQVGTVKIINDMITASKGGILRMGIYPMKQHPFIVYGNEDLARWLEDPTYPNSTLSWNVIHGSGTIKQNIWRSSNYYVALGNLNSEMVEVQMNLSIQALLYNTSKAYSKCMFRKGVCSLSVLFPQGNAIVINSPGVGKGSTSDVWNVKLSYGPRWFTYILCIGGLTVLALVAFNCLNKYQYTREGGDRYQLIGSERAPLLSHKDDDLSSWGSFYDSASNDEEDLGDFLTSGTLEGKSSGDGENGNNTRRLCAICFDAPRDCFFLPCGHCVACFACGTRIAEVAGNCPICRRNMKKVRKIFTV